MNKIFIGDEDEKLFVKSETINELGEKETQKLLDENNDKLETLSELASKIKAIKTDEDVIFIYVNLNFRKCRRTDQTGIELLIWLRLKGVMNHCVLHSFETTHALLNRQPKYLVATSKGTSFVQQPVDLKAIEMAELKKAEPENLKNTLKYAFNISEFRHREANWWGVKALFDVHNVISESNKREYPQIIAGKLSVLDNAVANYVFGFSVEKIQGIIKDEKECRQKHVVELESEINETIERLKEISSDVEIADKELVELKEAIKGLEESYRNSAQQGILCNRNDLQNQITEWIDLIKPQREKILKGESIKIAKEIEVNNLQIEILNVINIVKKKFEYLLTDYVATMKIIGNRKIDILYIDDNANNGWVFILQKMLPKATFKTIIPDKKYRNNIKQLFISQVKSEIKQSTTLILLDLRLFDEEERSIAIDSLSGEKLLAEIRQEFPSIPIVIITASNKIWTYEQLMKTGADCYWIKEGLDESRTAEDSVKNYLKLLFFIEKLSGSKYQLLRDFGNDIQFIKDTSDLWWKSEFDWAKVGSEHNMKMFNVQVKTTPNKDNIISILNDSYLFLREYLQKMELKNIYSPYLEIEWVIPSIIIQHLCKIVEIIHDFELYENQVNRYRKCQNRGLIEGFKFEPREIFKYDNSISDIDTVKGNTVTLVPMRNDKIGSELYDERNESSHTSNLSQVNFTKLSNFVNNICSYLITEPIKGNPFAHKTLTQPN